MLLNQYGTHKLEAFGQERSLSDWAADYGMDTRTLRQRLTIFPAEIALLLPRAVRSARCLVRAGAPKSWTWDVLPYKSDPWAQEFVEQHPGGATLEDVGDAIGLTRERVRQIEEMAMRKLRQKHRQKLREQLSELVEDVPTWRSRRSVEP